MPNDERQDELITQDDTTLSMRDRAELRRLALNTLKRILSEDNPPRNAGALVAAAAHVLDRTWVKPSVTTTPLQFNLQINAGALERWQKRKQEQLEGEAGEG